ncbi:MAG: hypothetical protein AAGB12_10515 [Pseudomonadota bacterium]
MRNYTFNQQAFLKQLATTPITRSVIIEQYQTADKIYGFYCNRLYIDDFMFAYYFAWSIHAESRAAFTRHRERDQLTAEPHTKILHLRKSRGINVSQLVLMYTSLSQETTIQWGEVQDAINAIKRS